MDTLRLDLHHAVHVAVDGLAAGVFHDHGHGRALVEDAQLALGRLLVGRVGEDATIQQSPVGVRNHGANVAGRIGLAAFLLGELQGLKVRLGLVGPVQRVAFVDTVDGSLLGDAHVGVGEDELAEGIVLDTKS